MVCIYCGHATSVTNSRLQKRTNSVWRRRRCQACQAIFSTSERLDYATTWLVSSTSAQLTAFSRDKLFLSIYTSCRHRSHPIDDAEALTDTVISKLQKTAIPGVPSKDNIRHHVLTTLELFDKVASTHYAAFHKS